MTDSLVTTPNASAGEPSSGPEAWIGLDWGHGHHALVVRERSGACSSFSLEPSPECLHQWLSQLGQKYRSVWLALEGHPPALMAVLVQYPWLTLYCINPASSDRFRKTFSPSGAKDDLPDAQLLLDLLYAHADKLRPWVAPDSQSALLDGLVQARRDLVDRRTKSLQRLKDLLKLYYPQALQLLGDLASPMALEFLRRWPELISLKAARPSTLKSFFYQHNVRSAQRVQERLELLSKARVLTTDTAILNVAVLQMLELVDELALYHKHLRKLDQAIEAAFKDHPDAPLFRNLPGAGKQMAPRLCAAFGTDRQRYPTVTSIQTYAGVAPVVEKSGQQKWVHWRWNAPKFLRQTLVEWAGLSILWSAWAKRYYERMSQKKKKHSVIVRSLAFKWLRVLWKCWQTHTPYDEEQYLQTLAKRHSPNAV